MTDRDVDGGWRTVKQRDGLGPASPAVVISAPDPAIAVSAHRPMPAGLARRLSPLTQDAAIEATPF
jgi:hypothetical protein